MNSVKSTRSLIALLIMLAMLLFVSGCSKSDDDEVADDNSGGGDSAPATVKYTPSGNEGQINGTVTLNGTAPEAKKISMDADPACAANNPNPIVEDVVAKDGKLQNVFVYVKDGKTADGKSIAGLSFDTPAEAKVLDQKGCHYVPHVLGIQIKQKLTVTNSDPTTHNVHPGPAKNPEWNQSQGPGAPPIEKTFDRSEVLIPVKCNQHPWMKSYIGVLSHPFYAVTGADGKFEIKGLPPGTYTIVAWQGKYPEKSQSVTVGVKEVKTQDFAFDASGATASIEGGSLKMMPAIEFPMPMKH